MSGLAADTLLKCTVLLLRLSQKRKKKSKIGSVAGSGGRSASSIVSTGIAGALVAHLAVPPTAPSVPRSAPPAGSVVQRPGARWEL